MNSNQKTNSALHILYEEFGQSPWLDNLRRDWIESGELKKWIEKGCRGITSNPTIFAKSMSEGDSYNAQISKLDRESSIENVYWQLVMQDIRSGLELLYPIYETSNGLDGYISVEVSPALADSIEGTVDAAKELWRTLDAPNLYIKVPATKAGISAIETLTAEGININVTLIFSLKRYAEVMDAYITGLRRRWKEHEGGLSQIHSVASFFVSRVDTEIDRQLEEIATPEALAARGKAAVAQAQLAYQIFTERFQAADFQELKAAGGNLQRPLWASVSTKNPEYSDTLYVDTLIGADTVSTMPENTLGAFMDHGKLERTLDQHPEQSLKELETLAELGIDMEQVANKLELEGVSSFSKSFEEALTNLETQSNLETQRRKMTDKN